MAKIKLNHVTLAYEIIGEGAPIVLTPGAYFPRNNWCYLQAGRFSKSYKVLLWDRRNTGASDLVVEDAISEWHLWADDLHHLLNALNLAPAYLAGYSAGSIFSLLMAHLYPEDVKALILEDIPTNNMEYFKDFFYARYFKFAEVAESKGMEAVFDFSVAARKLFMGLASDPNSLDELFGWIAESISANPSNHERLLSANPQKFAESLRQLGNWGRIDRFYLAQLTDEEINQITVPSLILHGVNELHPRHCAQNLHQLLPNSTWVEYTDWYPQELIDEITISDVSRTQKAALTMTIIEEFLGRNQP